MVKLYHFKRVWGVPDLSPFCVKVETYLRMADIPYKTSTNYDVRKAPKHKLPVIKFDGQEVADSSLIIDFLKHHFGDPLDASLTVEQHAQGSACNGSLKNTSIG
jgi:glutathione S-transferase